MSQQFFAIFKRSYSSDEKVIPFVLSAREKRIVESTAKVCGVDGIAFTEVEGEEPPPEKQEQEETSYQPPAAQEVV